MGLRAKRGCSGRRSQLAAAGICSRLSMQLETQAAGRRITAKSISAKALTRRRARARSRRARRRTPAAKSRRASAAPATIGATPAAQSARGFAVAATSRFSTALALKRLQLVEPRLERDIVLLQKHRATAPRRRAHRARAAAAHAGSTSRRIRFRKNASPALVESSRQRDAGLLATPRRSRLSSASAADAGARGRRGIAAPAAAPPDRPLRCPRASRISIVSAMSSC